MVGAGGMETWGGRRSAAYASMCGLSCRFSGRAGRVEEVRVFSGTAGTCRATVRDPGALCGRLGAGVVAYVPRYGAYVPPLPGSTGNGFVSGALLPLVASRAVCVGRIYSGLWRNYG